jgi:hypothetical protein
MYEVRTKRASSASQELFFQHEDLQVVWRSAYYIFGAFTAGNLIDSVKGAVTRSKSFHECVGIFCRSAMVLHAFLEIIDIVS